MSGSNVALLVGKYSVGGTLGTLLVAYGVNEVLFATAHSWSRQSLYQGSGAVLVFVGWVVLLVTLVNLYGELSGR
ncbi:hypothetical protein [Natrarchaeobius chitinivorans]|uniref:Uncharacterized protein n=1 Tax=Natrarchaeobius chitinivorans TaxID=1679083 RepID=A0A3N6M2I2_NATCH|nr:hypothetical protein [Natrarchaeobius chitinivorans]RQG94604.1 hypothetical protein EA473_10980 [Natrarchaeobius chitinivorans]